MDNFPSEFEEIDECLEKKKIIFLNSFVGSAVLSSSFSFGDFFLSIYFLIFIDVEFIVPLLVTAKCAVFPVHVSLFRAYWVVKC